MGCRHRFVVDLVEEIVGEGGSQSFFASSRTRSLSACFTTECGNPGILKSMSTSFNIERSWFASRQTTNFTILSWFVSSSTYNSCCHEKNVFGTLLLEGKQQVSSFYHDLGLDLVGLIGNFLLVAQLLLLIVEQLLKPNLSSSQGNLSKKPRWRIYLLVYDFSSFHPNNFRDTTSWECFVKNESVRSCLLELQSFLQNKVDVDPIHRILMFLPCTMHVLCKTRCFQVDRVRILMFLVQRIDKQKEYCVCCSNFVLPVSILNWWWNVNWLHIRRDTCTWRNRPEQWHCPVMKDQKDCVLNDLKELGGTELFLKNQNNTEVFSFLLLLLPCCSSTIRQTNDDYTRNVSGILSFIL